LAVALGDPFHIDADALRRAVRERSSTNLVHHPTSTKVDLFVAGGTPLDKEQMDGKWIEGDKLRNELANKPVLNANVLDHLLANPHLIPEEWKGKTVFFWGTIYRDQHDNLRVRCLSCRDDRWHWGAGWFGNSWSTRYPAAVSTPEVQQS
ncbi:MAG: hypothetical protein HYU35_02730, partial [Parcubacteria group bacterium]|nr:hypothetical protein [Parcubacteria group bacterium]